ncbi:MAG: hypothetical protein ACLQGP_12770 [Isosphaeraceae bacterium]
MAIIFLGLLLSSMSGLLGFVLIGRLHRARAVVRSATAVAGQPSRFVELLRSKLDDLIDRDLLAETGPGGLSEVAIKFREVHDASDVAGLLGAIASKAESRIPADLVEMIKHLLMLQHSLGVPTAEFDRCLREVVELLDDVEFHGTRIAKVTIPREGALFDSNTMWALKSGSRVKQPMGATLKDASGRVLSKSKVLCQ